MSKERITIECIRAGQPRAYADSEYESIMTIEWQGMKGYKDKDPPFIPRDKLHIGIIHEFIKTHVHNFIEEGKGDWASPRLKKCEEIGPGKWKVKVILPFTD